MALMNDEKLTDENVQSVDLVTQEEGMSPPSPPTEVVVVEKMSSPPPFPLSESKSGVAVDDMWPSLPARSAMQGMLPPPSLPLSGGGWMELFADNKENPTAPLPLGLAPSSSLQRRTSIKRTQPSKPLPNIVNTPSPLLVPVIIPVLIEKEEEELSQLLKEQWPIKEHKKPKENVPPTFQNPNPFSLLADMDREDARSQPPPVEKKSRKVRFQTPISDKEKVVRNISNPRKRSKSLDKGNRNMCWSFFITALLCIVPFLLVVLTSLKIGVYF